MINEERVKQLYKIALYEQKEEKKHHQTGCFYQNDYIGKELIKSIFSGTLAYLCMVILWAMSTWEDVLDSLNNLQIMDSTVTLVIIYLVFLAVYLVATYIVYVFRYEHGRKKIKGYMDDLKTINQMYDREEKLKL